MLLSAGRAVSILGVNACMSLTCPAAPAGVSQSVPINLKLFLFKNDLKNNNL
jgi:hypothetical protein